MNYELSSRLTHDPICIAQRKRQKSHTLQKLQPKRIDADNKKQTQQKIQKSTQIALCVRIEIELHYLSKVIVTCLK